MFSAGSVGSWEAESNGEFFLVVSSSVAVSSILFSAPGGKLNNGQDHEFSVAGVDVSFVPEPVNAFLLGIGLIGLAGFGRKKLFKN